MLSTTAIDVLKPSIKILQRAFSFSILINFMLFSSAVWAGVTYEKPPVLQASSILKPELLKDENYTIRDQVKNDGLFNHYTVDSTFGTFQAVSTKGLKMLIREIHAIAAMKQVETDEIVIESLKKSGENTVAGVKTLFADPQGTLEGAASGVGSLFSRAKGTIGRRETGEAEDNKLEQFVGISKSKGMIATKYGVNVYSRNKVLQEELDRLGQADFYGGLGVGVATSFVPGVGGIALTASGTARLLNETINTTPASELWLQNKNKLLGMGINSDTVELFLNNPSFSPAQSTVLVTALESMKGVANRGLFIKVALQSGDPVMARTITSIAVMSAGYHKNIAPLMGVKPMARITQGVRKDGARVVLLPIDYIVWNKIVTESATAIGSEAKGYGMELWVLGSVSKQVKTELQQNGWKVYTETASRLLPGGKK